MEKVNFMCLSKSIYWRQKDIQSQKNRDKYYGNWAPSVRLVKQWFTEFCCGSISSSNAERSGSPVGVTIPETTEKNKSNALVVKEIEEREITEAIGISHGLVVDMEYSLGYDKTIRKMCTGFTHNSHKRNRATMKKTKVGGSVHRRHHPPYSPDSDPSDYFLKKCSGRKSCGSNDRSNKRLDQIL